MVTYKHIWTPEEAAKTQAILASAEAKKRKLVKLIDMLLYWMLLVLAILANFVISVTLVPVLLAVKGPYLYLTLVFTGLSFGRFFSFALHSIEKLQFSQHVVAGILIPAVALINITIITALTNKLAVLMHMTTIQDPLVVGAFYVGGYVLPEILSHKGKTRATV